MNLLVKKAQRGDAEAFITLVEENKMTLRRVACGYLGNEEDIADAIQETILDAFEHMDSLKKPDYFKTWLVRILINNCNRIYHHNRKNAGTDEVIGYMASEADYKDVEFRELLRSLPKESRIIFQLYFGERFTTREIAELLDMKENTVKSRLHRGKEQLRAELQVI